MYADVAPAFHASARLASGAEVHFDTPRCLFHKRVREPGSLRDAHVTEHYSQQSVTLESVAYVVGSDVIGPMGRDLVPVARENVARFVADHGGQAIESRDVDASVLRRLDP